MFFRLTRYRLKTEWQKILGVALCGLLLTWASVNNYTYTSKKLCTNYTEFERYYGEDYLEWGRERLAMGFDSEVLTEAYDRTVTRTGKRSWAYMDKIVRSWQQKGLFTAQDVDKGDPRADRKKAAAAKPAENAGGDDLERLMRLFDKEET